MFGSQAWELGAKLRMLNTTGKLCKLNYCSSVVDDFQTDGPLMKNEWFNRTVHILMFITLLWFSSVLINVLSVSFQSIVL